MIARGEIRSTTGWVINGRFTAPVPSAIGACTAPVDATTGACSLVCGRRRRRVRTLYCMVGARVLYTFIAGAGSIAQRQLQ